MADESPEGPDDTNEPALVGAPAEQLTDTAALLRELSSLSGFGMDSVPVAGSSGDAPRPVAPRKAPPEPQKKKGRLFRR